MRISISCYFLFCLISQPLSAEVYSDFPTDIQSDGNYVFYSHGLIVEGTDPRPVHPEFGVYQFPEIIQALHSSADLNVIAHHRPAGTVREDYAQQLTRWVNNLLSAGVPPENITLIGFSRGAQITLLAADALRESGINTVIMAVCFNDDYPNDPPLELGGHVLSLYETSDVVQSCSSLLRRSTEAASTQELAISTGQRHGAFYTPQDAWLSPLRDWLALRYP